MNNQSNLRSRFRGLFQYIERRSRAYIFSNTGNEEYFCIQSYMVFSAKIKSADLVMMSYVNKNKRGENIGYTTHPNSG